MRNDKNAVPCYGCGANISGKNILIQMGGRWLCEECFQEAIYILVEKNPKFLAEKLGLDIAEPEDFEAATLEGGYREWD